jgi:hypothetical protein
MRGIIGTAGVLALVVACYAEDPAPEADPVAVRLETDRISFDFKDAPLNGVIEWLVTETKLKITVSEAAKEHAAEKKLKITAKLDDVKLRSAIRLLFETNGLDMSVVDGVVHLRMHNEVPAEWTTRRIDVRELLAPIPDFSAPDISLHEEEQYYGCCCLFYEESRRILEEPENLVSIVENATGGREAWQRDGCWLELKNGFLTCCHTLEVVEKVEQIVRQIAAVK